MFGRRGHRSPGAAVAVAVVAVAVVGAAGCGSSSDPVGEAEEGIAAALAERLEAADVTVSCPDDADLDDGSNLACDVTVDGAPPQTVPFAIGSGGAVSPAVAVIPTSAVEAYLVSELTTAAEGEVEVDCGDAALVLHDVGETFGCTVERVTDGAGFEVTVEVRSLDGSVTYTVATTTTTATTAPPVDPAATTVPP